MEFQIAEAVELIKTLAETENLTLNDALVTFVAEAELDTEYASQLKGALFERYSLKEMAEDSLTKALFNVFTGEGTQDIQELDTKETADGTKYKVRVADRESGSSYVRYATREKIAELRANPNISSVELTDYGATGEDDRGQKTAAAKGGGKDYDGDGKRESSSKEHAGVVHNAIQRAKGGKPDGRDTRSESCDVPEAMKNRRYKTDGKKVTSYEKDKDGKEKVVHTREETEVAEAIDPKGAARIDAAKGKKSETEDEKNRRLMLGKYSPAVRYGKKKMAEAKQSAWESYLSIREELKKKLDEDVVVEADLMDAGRENSAQRTKPGSAAKPPAIKGTGVDNSDKVRLMPKMSESVIIEKAESKSQQRLMGMVRAAQKGEMPDASEKVKELAKSMGKDDVKDFAKTKHDDLPEKKEKEEKKESVALDEFGMPILEMSTNNARPGPSEEMRNPPADPNGDVGHMNPKGKPKRYKERGEAPGDRRPNDPTGPDLPNEKGTVPNGAGA
jgi:hypothetical protein